ncbi:MAG: glycine--tRNA ligase subunit beta [Desulfuromonadaceae bacterium]|nr:glycine--tRNA ligase subunit beta [Desulfuromonadaceae bacterium]
MSSELLLEIGTEEIPAGFLPPARKSLEDLLRKEFETARIPFQSICSFATPRRLTVAAEGVARQQQRQELSISGPPAKIAFDDQGNPTKAALGFAKTNGVEVSELKIVETPKGSYLHIAKVVEGQEVKGLLPDILAHVIASIPFRKSMRWKDLDVRFARPVHWIVALFDGEVVPFRFGELASGNHSRGHRFMAPEPFAVSGLEEYLREAEKRFVIPDPEKRKEIIRTEIETIAGRLQAKINMDEELVEEVAHLVEFPSAICGSFEEKYLQLPRELLITTMRANQRYFTLTGADGKLLPHFITIANTRAGDPEVVRRGNERVLRARLSDAMFFWKEDQKIPLESRLETLKNVVFQARLGTSYDKVMRIRQLSVSLADQFAPELAKAAERVALLAKCDLETLMVYEFPELQGVMGREYALLEGEAPEIAKAIYEHYLPIQAGGELPSGLLGSFVSIADKIDTLCGCFGVGLLPTGTADPFALRRGAIGILNIVIAQGFPLSLPDLVRQSLALLQDKLKRPAAEVKNDVIEFLRLRFLHILTSQGYPQDIVNAVLAASFDQPVDVLRRVEALARMKKSQDFEPLAVAFKRVVNIIKGGVAETVSESLLNAPSEKNLFRAITEVREKVMAQRETGDYPATLDTIASLRPAVDSFFDEVLVMDPDERLRTNRLALLTSVARLFEGIADFSKISE